MSNHPSIFLSYSFEDREFASRLTGDLNNAGFETHTNCQHENQANWVRITKDRLRNCAAFLPVISPSYVESQYCQHELTLAAEEGYSIVPVLLKPIQEVALPYVLNGQQGFYFFDWCNTDSYSHEFHRLIVTISVLALKVFPGHGVYNTDITMAGLEGEPLPEERSDKQLVLQADFEALEPVGRGADWQARYTQANWWNWNSEDWELFLKQQARQEQENDLPDQHKYERVLVEYGKWILRHPDANEQDRLFRVYDTMSIHLAFWQFGKECPSELALPG